MFTWTVLLRFVSVMALMMWAMSGQPLHISAMTRRARWIASPVCQSSVGEKHTHTHYNRLLLLLCVKAFPPVTRAVRWVEGCVKYQCERSAGWAAAQRDRGSGPAVDLISPMGLPAGKACLIWYTCATSCLSCCLALWRWVEAWREGGVCMCVSIMCMCEDSWSVLLPYNDLPDLSVYRVSWKRCC